MNQNPAFSADGAGSADQSPADELLVFGGADGFFIFYDDAGDGMEYLRDQYLRIPLRWDDRAETLLAGAAEGSLAAGADLRVRLIRPDGTGAVRQLVYRGDPVRVPFR